MPTRGWNSRVAKDWSGGGWGLVGVGRAVVGHWLGVGRAVVGGWSGLVGRWSGLVGWWSASGRSVFRRGSKPFCSSDRFQGSNITDSAEKPIEEHKPGSEPTFLVVSAQILAFSMFFLMILVFFLMFSMFF